MIETKDILNPDAGDWTHRTLPAVDVGICRGWLDDGAVYLDTETTGLDNSAEIIEICVLDRDGNELINTLVKPRHPIPADATAIHGITDDMVADAPTWPQIDHRVRDIFEYHPVVIYNRDYDMRLIAQSQEAWGLASQYLPAACAMLMYAHYHQIWDTMKGRWKWQKLGAAAEQMGIPVQQPQHRAKADCLTTLGIVKAVAESVDEQ